MTALAMANNERITIDNYKHQPTAATLMAPRWRRSPAVTNNHVLTMSTSSDHLQWRTTINDKYASE